MRKIWIGLVKLFGWRFEVPSLEERPELLHCVVAVAPHTSFKDFFVGLIVNLPLLDDDNKYSEQIDLYDIYRSFIKAGELLNLS